MRRSLHHLKCELAAAEETLAQLNPLAAAACGDARNAAFLAWTVLANPLIDDDEH